MPASSLDEELTVIEHLDFDLECAWDKCPARATWLAVVRCCKNEILVCNEHREFELSLLKSSPRRTCIACGFRWDNSTTINIDWTKL